MIYILLPVHNRVEVTRRFLDCLCAQSLEDFHLILVDDGSTDGTADMVVDRIPSTTVLRGTGDWWWAGALQQGYRWLKGRALGPSDIVLIMNDDTTFGSEFLARGSEIILQRERVLLGARWVRSGDGGQVDGGVVVDWKRLDFTPVQSGQTISCLPTRGLFMRATDFIDLGGFRPRLLPHYLSDYEFTIRAHRRGYQLRVHPDLVLEGNEATTGIRHPQVDSFRTFVQQYFSIRSPDHPLSWLMFTLLASPWKYKLPNALRVLYRAARAVHGGMKYSRRW